ncbi:SRPBCC domain-containing protein [Rhodocytophaga rosea]|uniref:SRPBCC domain-containing protein n=1 Tax=Rhodocytophaga rosea TaxID=2704465 RepID=A0A6C0GQ44_9BACT|nr:SRPBCC domain-containing protein [Rhodocytophaga rosea]QHT69974.1 SRPBCC domain-containing protein [Rhodocytophaga rosea]
MNNNLAFDFSVNKENNTIDVKREFAVELPLVWDAYTKSEILDQWWAPKPWKARTKTMDFREGGRWHYAMVGPEGEEHWSLVNYKSIQTRKNFTGLDAFADAEGNVNKDMPQSTWEINFSDKGQVTLVEICISYDDLSQLETTLQMGFKEGLSKAMEGLDELLASAVKSK